MSNYQKVFRNLGLELFPREEYQKTNLPDKEKKILCEEGLPEISLYFLHFNTEQEDDILLNNSYVIIGDDNGNVICIKQDGKIVSIDSYGKYKEWFVNSNLECLLECVAIFLMYDDRLATADDKEASVLIEEIRQQFNQVDANALDDDENWWPVILEQIEWGLM